MRLSTWIWRLASDYPGAVGSNDSTAGLGEAWVKTNDGLTWQGSFESHPLRVTGHDAIAKLRNIYAEQDITLQPWGVVHGRMPGALTGYATSEGALAGAIAGTARMRGRPARYNVDLEPYYHGGSSPQFWRNDLGAGAAEVREFIAAFRDAGGEELWITPDARPGHLEPVAFAEWLKHDVVTMVCPMVYWVDFGRSWKASVDTALEILASYGVPASKVHPVYSANGTPSDTVAAVRYARERGCAGVSFWRRGVLRPDVASALRALDDPWGDATSLAPDVRTALEEQLRWWRDTKSRQEAALNGTNGAITELERRLRT